MSIAFVHGLLGGVGEDAEIARQALSSAGIAQALLGEPAARVSADQYGVLCMRLIELSGDEGFGFFARPLRRGSFALMCRAMLGAPSLLVAVRRLAQAVGLLQDDLRLELVKEGAEGGGGELSGLQIVEAGSLPLFLHETLLRMLLRQVAWLHGGRLRARRYDFAFAPPAHATEYGQVFPAALRFSQAHSAVWFDTASLAGVPRRDDAALREFLRHAPSQIVLPHRAERSVSARVRSDLQQAQPAHWPSLAEAADALHMAVSTLQRRLAAEGTSFQAVKDELRRDLAIVRLSGTTLPMAELATELGFADSAAFQRAFKTWTGSAPGAYRRSSGTR